MEISGVSMWVMLLLNALVCIVLPFAVTFNWSNLFSHLSEKSSPKSKVDLNVLKLEKQ